MTNRQRYQRAFGALHVSKERLREVYFMKKASRTARIGRAILIGACVMALLTVSAYAANEATGGAVFGRIVALVDGITGKLIPRDQGYRVMTEDGRSYDVTVVEPDGNGAAGGSDGITYQVDLGEGEDVPDQFEMQFEQDVLSPEG